MATVDNTETPKRDNNDDAHDNSEAATLLTKQNPSPTDGVANSEPGAMSSTPLLVHADQNMDSGANETKPKRKKPSKSRKTSATGRSRTRKSIPKDTPTTEGSPRRDESSKIKADDQDQHTLQHLRHQRTVAFSLWRMISSCVCLRGSMRVPMSATELPELSLAAQTKWNSLDKLSRKKNVEVFVRHTDNMPFSSSNITSYGHPIVVIHVVDVCTGLPLAVHQHTGPARFSAHMRNAFEWNVSLVWRMVALRDFVSTQVIVLFEIVEPRRRRVKNRGSSTANNQHENNRQQQNLDHDLSSEAFYGRIAWCFFKPISDQGNIRLPSLAAPDKVSADNAVLRLQLFRWFPMSWLDMQQARSQFQWNPDAGDGVPTVFLQYQRRTRMRLPSTLHVEIRPVASRETLKPLDGVVEATTETEPTRDNKGDEALPVSNQAGPVDEATNQPQPEQIASSKPVPDPLLHCKRHTGEACIVPQRVLYRLPTGRKGCSCVAFSPDGLFLAAGVHHVTSTTEDWIIHIYEINTGTLWQSCRGHQGMIYSVKWGVIANGTKKALVSASSDGSAMVWELRETALDRVHASTVLPTLILQHVPAPVFVYCAMFHPTRLDFIVTGASDGRVRLWDTQSTSGRSATSTPVFEWKLDGFVAIHSIEMETKASGRLYCGDSSGNITVWMPVSGQDTYELSKTVRTGQQCIASMALHPRKQHLLVLTHPHALFQYETRSFLLLHKKYAGIECDQLLAKASFSPDGQFVVSGSEDGVPHLFGAVEGVRVDGSSGGLWGHRFFHGFPLVEISWSPTAHVVAMGAYGENHPIVVLYAKREDRLVPSNAFSPISERWRQKLKLGSQIQTIQSPSLDSPDQTRQRRQQRQVKKLVRELDAGRMSDVS